MQGGADASVQALYNGFAGSLHNSQAPNQFHPGAAPQVCFNNLLPNHNNNF